ncbi:Hypothetical predicted protein [Cloeon dipterum]|uniref:Uncharacterized protein n=1 Tax=Cloeon dipterum TaxID=197152 RepID=A0A8S1CLH8_9INSE|nr:Hypothetical predicted protein [Cloeon dipterum]
MILFENSIDKELLESRNPILSPSLFVFRVWNPAGSGDTDFFFPSHYPAPEGRGEFLRIGSGDAPRYPDWVYRHVVLPRLLFEEHQRIAARADAQFSSSAANQVPFETHLDTRRFDQPYDFEWWLDSEAEEDLEAEEAGGEQITARKPNWKSRLQRLLRALHTNRSGS